MTAVHASEVARLITFFRLAANVGSKEWKKISVVDKQDHVTGPKEMKSLYAITTVAHQKQVNSQGAASQVLIF